MAQSVLPQLGAPFDVAQDMLCVFARVIPIWVAALPCWVSMVKKGLGDFTADRFALSA
jgi:hypothetical protein